MDDMYLTIYILIILFNHFVTDAKYSVETYKVFFCPLLVTVGNALTVVRTFLIVRLRRREMAWRKSNSTTGGFSSIFCLHTLLSTSSCQIPGTW